MRTNGLVAKALWQLLRYDVELRLFGFGAVYGSLAQPAAPSGTHASTDTVLKICAAVRSAMSLYWRPVKCLQRSVVTARLLRQLGVDARLTIGFREAPFFGHAWVEVEGRIVNDSPSYRERLHIVREPRATTAARPAHGC